MTTTELTELMQSESITTEAQDMWPEIIPLESHSIKMPQFSWDMLPPVLGDMGAEITRTINVSPMLVLGAILGCASTAVGKKALIRIKKDHCQFANLFFLVSAPPCTGKSPVMAQAIKPLNDWEALKHNEWEEATQKYNKQAKEIEVKKVKLEKSRRSKKATANAQNFLIESTEIEKAEKELGRPPVLQRIIADDATSEALARIMYDNGGSIGILSAEGRKFISIMLGRYNDRDDYDLMLKGHSGDSCKIDRRNALPIRIDAAVVSACIMTQPDALGSLSEKASVSESGLLARFIYLVPEATSGEYPTENIANDIRASYNTAITEWLNRLPHNGTLTSAQPLILEMPSQIFASWKIFHDSVKRTLLNEADSLPAMYIYWLGKLPETVARFLLLFHCFRRPLANFNTAITEADFEAVLRLAEVLKAQALLAISNFNLPADIIAAKKAWRWIDRHREEINSAAVQDGRASNTVKARDLQQKGVFKTADETKSALDKLTEHNYLKKEISLGKNRQKGDLYIVRPQE